MNADQPEFNRGAVRPLACLREAWQLIKDDYWLFLGIILVGLLMSSLAHMILGGPMMCGIHLCLLRREREQTISFNNLFQGFEYFLPGLVATVIMTVPMIVLLVGSYLFAGVGVIGTLVAFAPERGEPPDPAMVWSLATVVWLVIAGGITISMILSALFMFTYPLIVDRRLSGFDAILLSIRAVMGNLGGVIGLTLLIQLLGLVGVMACYVGFIFVLPLNFAVITIAYRQVFPAPDLRLLLPVEPEYDELPPAAPQVSGDTGIQPTNSV